MKQVCRHCGEEKPLNAFRKNRNCKTGYERTCLDCTRLRSIEYRSREIDPASIPDFLICNSCRLEKPKDRYSKSAGSKYGLRRVCKSCEAERKRAWESTEAGRLTRQRAERRRAEAVKSDPDKRSRYKTRRKIASAKYGRRPEVRDRQRQQLVEWRERNPVKRALQLVKRAARKRGEDPGDYPVELLEARAIHNLIKRTVSKENLDEKRD